MKQLYIIIGLVILAGLGYWFLQTQPEENIASEQSFDLVLAERSLNPRTVTVTEGDTVTLKVATDELGEFHITGYEIEKDLIETGTLEVAFAANLPGQFRFELHPEVIDTMATATESSSPDTSEQEASGDEDEHMHEHEDEGTHDEDIVIGTLIVNPR